MSASAPYQLVPGPAPDNPGADSSLLPRAGAAISNLKALGRFPRSSAGLGTLGFFAAKQNASNWESLVLVSNRHVLLANGAVRDDVIFQPNYEERGRQLIFPPQLNAIAKIDNEGLCGHFSYAYPGESAKSYYIDCATASLLLTQGKNPRPARRSMHQFARMARVRRLDTAAGRELKVRLLGRGSSAWGRVVDSGATVETASGERCSNTIVIRALPGRDGSMRPFSGKGDSGALLVDHHQRAVGLLWGGNTLNPLESYACHIHPVLSCLRIIPWRFDFCAPGPPTGCSAM